MTRFRTLALGLALALTSLPASAVIALHLAPNFDQTYNTKYPLGDKPQELCTFPTGYTEAAKGTGAGEICSQVDESWEVTALGADDEGDFKYGYKTCASGDCQVVARIADPSTWTGHSEQFTGFGVGISEGTADDAWYFQAFETPDGRIRCKGGTPGPDDYNALSADASLGAEYVAVIHDDDLDLFYCAHSEDGIAWTFFGQYSHAATEPNIGYAFGESHDTTETTTAVLSSVSHGTTITIDQPPVPNQPPVMSALPDQLANQDVAFSFNAASFCSDLDGDPLTFSANIPVGLGLSISLAGTISGTPNSAAVAASPLSITVICADDGLLTAQDTFVLTVNAAPPPPTGRKLLMEADFETGQIQADDYKVNNVFTDTGRPNQVSPVHTFTVTGISNAAQAVMNWTGTDPAVYEGFTLGATGGIPQMRGKLFRCESTGYNATTNTCQLVRDGDENGHFASGTPACGWDNPKTAAVDRVFTACQDVNSSTYGAFNGNSTATTWERLETLNGGLGPSSTLGVHVVQTGTFTPPSNINGAAQGPWQCLTGNYCLSARLDYWPDYSTFDGNGGKMKVRWIDYMNNTPATEFAGQTEVCASVGVFLPSNYEHYGAAINNSYANETINFPKVGDNVTVATILQQKNADGSNHWTLDFDNGSGRTFVDLGSVTPDINKWTVFTIDIRTGSSGKLKVWKSTGNVVGPAPFQRADTLKYNRSGAVSTNTQAMRFHPRQYLHSWHYQNGFLASDVNWIGYDAIRVTRPVIDGSSCYDVHPFGHGQVGDPLN